MEVKHSYNSNLKMNGVSLRKIVYFLAYIISFVILYHLVLHKDTCDSAIVSHQSKQNDVTQHGHERPPIEHTHHPHDTEHTDQLRHSKAYQDSLRNIGSDVTDMWWFIQSEMEKLKSLVAGNAEAVKFITKTVDAARGYHSAIVNDQLDLETSDNTEQWRLAESKALAAIVRERIYKLQHPTDCTKVKFLMCDMGWYHSGIGYVAHHAAYCLINAYRMGRTLLFETKGWTFSPTKDHTLVFKPLSQCVRPRYQKKTDWGKHTNETRYLYIGRDALVRPIPPHLPPEVPADIAERLSRFHGDPSMWWVSQFVHYVWQLQPEVQQYIDRGMRQLKFTRPIVGVHWRSNELYQGTYAQPLDAYMRHVKDYYDVIGQRSNVTSRRVFLSTDAHLVNVMKNITRFPEYKFLVNEKGIRTAEEMSTRYSEAGLMEMMLDVTMLAQCDFVICTMTSNVCRLIAELKQLSQADPSTSVISLDTPYRSITQRHDIYRAWTPHVPKHRGELQLKVGDLINRDPVEHPKNGFDKNYQGNGYSLGNIGRRRGHYPTYKARRVVSVSDALNVGL